MTEAGKSVADKSAHAHSGRKACAGGTLAVLATAAAFLLVGRYVVPSNGESGCAAQRSAAAAPLPDGSVDGSGEQRTLKPTTTDSSVACVNSSHGHDGFVRLESVHRVVDTDLLVEAIVDQALEEHVRFLAKEPHVSGSPREEQVLAQYVADRLTEYGFDEVQFQPYHVLLSYPNASDPNTVQLLNATTGEVLLDAAFQENTVDGVDTDIGPAFLAYSPPGDVLGCLVYVNRATHEDLDDVEALNVSVSGCLCLARYGGTTLASKAYTCARKGAVGLLVFPDSNGESDGTKSTSTLEMFPSGPEMPETVLRRDTMMQVGDPLTPGVPAIPSAERMDPAFAGLPPIPSQPISYRDAQLLLRSLEGPEAPEHFRLTENVTYRLGDASSDRLVRLRVNNMFTLAQINNVIATLRGSVEPDRYVVVGAQRDSFGFGALHSAPNTASLLALGQALGSLKKRGVRPRRSVLLCSWAAGEYGQVGSTEWVEVTIPPHSSVISVGTEKFADIEGGIEADHLFAR
ncbi:aminopeptidase NAALADL1 [Rhipicephalus sanguineus]|uniref:aminopeptidase NAALADL1 n=1 Tax=Rhipicephalus sanguineus TaxID=34632 RepID=UPI0020C2F157|nr:aminopeptidase NAALADL1 [Rhipicephalus sanguineus]